MEQKEESIDIELKKQREFESRVREYKRRVFGQRYVDACLSRIDFSVASQEKMYNFLTTPRNFLVFLGNPGVGKTYFCAAMTEWLYQNIGYGRFRYFHEKDLLFRLRKSISESHGDYLDVLKDLIDDQFLIVDDIGSQKKSEWTEEILFDLLDYRYNSRLPTIFTSNLSKQEFNEYYHPRVSSRLFATEHKIINIENSQDLRESGL